LPQRVARLKNLGRRSEVGPKIVFKRAFSKQLVQSSTTASSLKAMSSRKGNQGPKVEVKPESIEKYIAMIVDVCANRLTNWTDYVRDPDRNTNLSSNEYEILKTKLNLNYRECFLLLNEAFKELIEVGGFSAVDETIWAFKGLSAYTVYMDRKPKDFGLRFYPWCFELTLLKRPVCYHVIPDLCTPHLTAAQIMEEIKELWPTPHSKTEMSADSYFTSLGWIESHPDLPVTLAMAKGRIENLIPIFSKDLTVHEYRVFSEGDIMLSI